MFAAGMSLEALHECLVRVEPMELQGMRLLRAAHPATGFFPQDVPRETVSAAVIELVQYTERCANTAYLLRDLRPIPLTTIPLLEYGL